jgi:DNA-directed RNA polymerase specialized sigma24 family protein
MDEVSQARGRREPRAANVDVPFRSTPAFPETQWSLIVQAGRLHDREALSRLFAAYWSPVYCFLLSLGAKQDASDLTQGLFADLIERGDLAGLDAARGRFRTWLRTCARNYLYKQRARASSLVRGGRARHVSLDAECVEPRVQALLEQGLPPDQIFDRCWARLVAERALLRLRAQCALRDDAELALDLLHRLSSDDDLPSDACLSAQQGRSRAAIRVERCRVKAELKTQLTRCLQDEIRATVDRPADIDAELRELVRALLP